MTVNPAPSRAVRARSRSVSFSNPTPTWAAVDALSMTITPMMLMFWPPSSSAAVGERTGGIGQFDGEGRVLLDALEVAAIVEIDALHQRDDLAVVGRRRSGS